MIHHAKISFCSFIICRLNSIKKRRRRQKARKRMEELLPPRQAAQLKTYLQFNASTSGRDKVFRLIQSVANLYLWKHSTELEEEEKRNLQQLSSSLGTTRSFLKLGNFLNSFNGALTASKLEDSLLRFLHDFDRLFSL